MIDARTFLLALIGYPVGHSRSPRLHNAALAATGQNGVYLALETPPEGLVDAIHGVRAWRLRGLNVTIPHKVAVIPLLDGLTPAAQVVGAVNTLFWEGDRLFGDNTDVAGFQALLGSDPLEGAHAVVLGAGGSARAVAHALGLARVRTVSLAVRRTGASLELIGAMAATHPDTTWQEVPWTELDRLLPSADRVINSTPIGMDPEGGRSPLDPSQITCLKPTCQVLDLVYNPSPTKLVALAAEAGLVARAGLPMLVAQAQAAFERWTGRAVPEEVWLRALLEPDSVRKGV